MAFIKYGKGKITGEVLKKEATQILENRVNEEVNEEVKEEEKETPQKKGRKKKEEPESDGSNPEGSN